MKMMPKAMPSDQISPMAESSRIRFPEDVASMPSAEATAKSSAPAIGSAPR